MGKLLKAEFFRERSLFLGVSIRLFSFVIQGSSQPMRDVNILVLCKSFVTNEVDSGIQMCRRSVQLLTFNILVLL